MSLRRALEQLPHDRETEGALRRIVDLFYRHDDEWFPPERVAVVTNTDPLLTDSILGTLRETFVLDFDDGPPRYAYHADSLLEIEIDRFTRRADSHTDYVQDNVDRFRRRFGRR